MNRDGQTAHFLYVLLSISQRMSFCLLFYGFGNRLHSTVSLGKLIFFASFYFLIFLALFLPSIATEFASLEVLKLEKQIAEKQVNLYC